MPTSGQPRDCRGMPISEGVTFLVSRISGEHEITSSNTNRKRVFNGLKGRFEVIIIKALAL